VSRVLLTGASGFVGRHALLALARAGHEVHAVARPRAPDATGVRRCGPDVAGVRWHGADLLDGCEVVDEVRPELLVHLAWYAEHARFWSSVENVRWVEASLALLRAFVRAGGRRAVIAGSCAEYEWSRELYPEDAPLRPATLYGAAKHALHVVGAALAEQAGVELAWARLFFLYGPFEDPARFVPSLALALLHGERAPMTEGSQRRDFMHVADAGAALAALADSPARGAVNVASGVAPSLRELGRRLARIAGREDLLAPGARPTPAGEPPVLLADVRRLRDEVDFRPRVELDEGLRGAIDWWRERLSAAGPDDGRTLPGRPGDG
jgi:nucleoside-diphosphate-sugar epimerase